MVDELGSRTLLLLRHATTEDFRPGHQDRDRRLTETGRSQAEHVGDRIRAAGLGVDRVLCSPARRTRQTLDALGLDTPTEFVAALYNAGSDTLLGFIRELPDEVRVALVLAHAPGLPRLAYELAGPGSSPLALVALERQFGTATLARIEVDGPWAELMVGRLSAVEPACAEPPETLSIF